MGTTPKPLSYLIDHSVVQSPEDHAFIREKMAQGHSVKIVGPDYGSKDVDGSPLLMIKPLSVYDVILAPNAWRAFDMSSFDLATKSARAVKYKPGAKKPKKATKPRKKKSAEEIAEAT